MEGEEGVKFWIDFKGRPDRTCGQLTVGIRKRQESRTTRRLLD